jgi:S1-C subfamily serine protease
MLVAHDVDLDLALLELDIAERVPNGARLPTRERLAEVQVFDPVYAVGCPLGNDPIPTAGEIASTNHRVDGSSYWMISAPTYIGNSGGGIFDARTHELLGIFSKIYTHGSLRSTIVPHMGLVTPMPTIYEWFESVGYGEFAKACEPPAAGAPEEAAAQR